MEFSYTGSKESRRAFRVEVPGARMRLTGMDAAAEFAIPRLSAVGAEFACGGRIAASMAHGTTRDYADPVDPFEPGEMLLADLLVHDRVVLHRVVLRVCRTCDHVTACEFEDLSRHEEDVLHALVLEAQKRAIISRFSCDGSHLLPQRARPAHLHTHPLRSAI